MNSKSCRGSFLIVSLLLMLMLTVMAVSQISFNTTQTRIASNSADLQIAFQTAEGALNEGTNNILAGSYSPVSFVSNLNGLYTHNPSNDPLWTTINWSSAGAVITSFQGGSKVQAAYIIEQLPSVIAPGQNANNPASVYRITARAVGATGNPVVILQSTEQIQQ